MIFVLKSRTPTEAKADGDSVICPTKEKLLLILATRVFSQNSLCINEPGTMTIRIPAGLSTSYALSM